MVTKQSPEPGSPIANLQKTAKCVKDEGDLTQAEKFEAAAHELGCDEDEDRFKGVLRKLAKPTSDKPKS